MAEQVAHVVHVMELLTQPECRTLECEQVTRMRHEHLQVRQAEELIEVAAWSEIPLDRVVSQKG